jgi:hypothetical protein
MMRRITGLVALSAVIIGCSWRQTPVPVAGDPQSIDRLVGNWAGEYSSLQTGRSGSITFELAEENNSAYGDIVMVAKPGPMQVGAAERQPGSVQIQRATMEPLKIRFVRADNGRITGTLDTYKDPDCGCNLITTFEGAFTSENKIEGTFHSRGTDFGHVPADGKWSVTRQKPGTR